MVADIGMEVIDGRDALALIVIRETPDGEAMAEVKSLTIDKLSAARMLYGLAKQLKALHDAESSTVDRPRGCHDGTVVLDGRPVTCGTCGDAIPMRVPESPISSTEEAR